MKKKLGTILKVLSIGLTIIFSILEIIAKLSKKKSNYEDEPGQKSTLTGKTVSFVEDEEDQENADGVKGHLEVTGDSDYKPGFYEKYMKRGLDIVLSFGGLVVLAPVFAMISLAIIIDDPGPILFTQKRLGQNKKYFKLHKFRSMKMCTPHDVPTHMLENPEQYITRVGSRLSTKEQKKLQRNGNTAFCGVFFLSIFGFCPYYGYQHV